MPTRRVEQPAETTTTARRAIAAPTATSTDHADLDGLSGDTVLDAFIFARDDRQVRNVWSAGRHLVRDGRHMAAEDITATYRKTVRRLRAAL